MLTKSHLWVSCSRLSFSLFCSFSLTEEANLFMCQVFARFIFHQTPPANLLASCHQPGDTLLEVLKASLTQSHDLHRRHARSNHWVNVARSHATRLSLWQRCHSQDKSPSISTGSKGIMVLGRRRGGEPDALSTGHGPIICGSEISQCDFATRDSQKKKKKEEGSSFCLQCCGFCITPGEVGRSHIQINRKEEKQKKKNPHQDLCPNGAHYCNYKAQISDQALR